MKKIIIFTAISIATVASSFAQSASSSEVTTTGPTFNLLGEINQIERDEKFGAISHEEAIKLIHSAEMRDEIEKNEAIAAADRRATRAYYRQFLGAGGGAPAGAPQQAAPQQAAPQQAAPQQAAPQQAAPQQKH